MKKVIVTGHNKNLLQYFDSRIGVEKDIKNNVLQYLISRELGFESINEHVIHSIRVANLAELIGSDMGLSHKELTILFISGLLHDIGKKKIPSFILNKPSRLSREERQVIEKHSVYSEEIILSYVNSNFDEVEISKIARHHHENFDGSGYPDKLKDTDIPLFSRILCIVDVYDAISNPRVYRKNPINNPIELMTTELYHKFDKLILDKYAIKQFERVSHKSLSIL